MNDFGTAVAEIEPPEKFEKPTGGLSKISKGKIVKPRRTLIYGVHGIGKSTWANSAPKPIFLPTEEGVNDLDCESFPLAQSWAEVEANLRTLAMEDHDYQTVVIDSLDWLERLIWAAVCADVGAERIEDIGYGKGYTAALDWWTKLFKALSYLREQRHMAIVFIAHAKVDKFENPEDENYNRYTLALHKTASAMLQEWCDEVFFANYKVYTKSVEESFGKKTAKAIGGDERVLRTSEKPFATAKNRLAMPDEIEMKWCEYAKFFPGKKEV